MKSNTAKRAWLRFSKTVRSISSHSKVAKKASAKALSDSSHRLSPSTVRPRRPAGLGEVVAGVLRTLVAVMHDDAIGPAADDGHLKSSGDQLVCCRTDMDQPTTRRLKTSMITPGTGTLTRSGRR
jgi:hypothetical protein